MPHLFVICGPAGTGKSTYGRKMAAERRACLLDSDTVTEPVVRAGLELAQLDPDDRDSVAYKEAFRDAVYECLYGAATENLPHTEVVLVGPFTREIRDPEWPAKLAERFGVHVELIFVTCDPELRKQRIIERRNPRDQSKLDDWEGYLAKSCDEPPGGAHRVVYT